MNVRRTGFVLVGMVVTIIAGFALIGGRQHQAPDDPGQLPRPTPRPVAAAPADAASDPLAGFAGAGLNAPTGNVARDLAIVEELLTAWRTNYPHQGNPVGDNRAITAALRGDNPLHLDFIPRGHPALNARGELCDRWGTPFIFHQISGTDMELRSAGPDRLPYTLDDTLGNPSSQPSPARSQPDLLSPNG